MALKIYALNVPDGADKKVDVGYVQGNQFCSITYVITKI